MVSTKNFVLTVSYLIYSLLSVVLASLRWGFPGAAFVAASPQLVLCKASESLEVTDLPWITQLAKTDSK